MQPTLTARRTILIVHKAGDEMMRQTKNGYESDQATSRRMSAVRPLDTTPEKTVRRVLTRLGFRYRLNRMDLPGRPDVVFAGRRRIIFVHGCYWHRHEGCTRTTTPKRNEALWQEKFEKTVSRDRINRTALEESGWRVLVVWECETLNEDHLEQRLREFMNEDD